MTSKIFRLVVCNVLFGVCATKASAVELFSDNFNTAASSSLWTQNKAGDATKQQAQFAFDYSIFGIPPAPGSSDTLGLRLRANLPIVGGNEVTTRPPGAISGLSLSPTGKNFGTNYTMSVDVWANYFGTADAQGLFNNLASPGGTFNVMFGTKTSGTVPLVVGNPGLAVGGQMDGVGLATSNDGGIGIDYRLYPVSGTYAAATNPPYMAASTDNKAGFYTALFPQQTAPLVQWDLATAEYNDGSGFNPMSGFTEAGTFGFAWHHVVITVENNIVTWDVDGTRLVSYDATGKTFGGNNIAIGTSDVNDTTARYPSLAFTIFDNLVVTGTAPVNLGDFNSDGKVDASDYITWRKNTGNASLPNDNGSTTQAARYTLWRTNFGNPPGAGTGLEGAEVPEPSSFVLFLVSAGCLMFSGRKRAWF